MVARVRAADARAWEQFVELYGPLLFFWARRGGLNAADAADLTQDVFLAIARSIDRFDKAKGSLRGWMLTIVRNKVADHYRQRPAAVAGGGTEFLRRLQELPDAAEEAPEEQSQTQALFRRALAQVEAEFERRTWMAFWRVVVEGQDTAAVAADLGLSASSVRQAKSRVLRRLREQLGDWLPE